MKLKQNIILVIFIAIAGFWVAQAQAAEEHTHEGDGGHDTGHENMSHGSDSMFLVEKEIDGYTVSFHVMEAQQGMNHGGSHNFMIKVEQNNKTLNDVTINSKVIYPDGKDESKALMKMGDWYMAGYDLASKGKHQMMILFKTSDGKKHKGGVYYPNP